MSMCACLLSVVFILGIFHNVCSSNCTFQDGKYDLSSLDRVSGWPVPGFSINGTQYYYKISLCRPLNIISETQANCAGSSICMISHNSSQSYGNAIENSNNFAIADNFNSGFSLYVLTRSLCKDKGIYRANINFVCGPNLGAPELLFFTDCQVNFYWKTSAACLTKPKNKQVPCYVLDNNGKRRDLSPLIKETGGYNVTTTQPNTEFIINVCSDLNLNDSSINCPKNVSACRVSGKETAAFGSVTKDVMYTPEGILLTYSSNSSELPPDCLLPPKTKILFRCPKRGLSQPPKLLSDSYCQYEVLWETEYACPEDSLKGNFSACQFTQKSHGVEIDLSPLQKLPFFNISSPSTSSFFILSVCGGLKNFVCGDKNWKFTSVCAVNATTGVEQIVGTTQSADFIYADNSVILRYKYDKGSLCNGAEQSSSIHFICDMNATKNGDGEPIYVPYMNDSCSHVFEWRTKHACLKSPLDTSCSVTFNKKTINLQKLVLTEGKPWEALDLRPERLPGDAEYFINVCGQVSELGNLSDCGQGSAACIRNKKGEYINLGYFTSALEYDNVSNTVELHYSGGSLCKNNKDNKKSTIEFICKPGHINSYPVLTHVDELECHYKFEWQTAEACPVGVIEGSDCRIFDSDFDIKFDLSPLKSTTYEIETDSYKFYMGICEPVKASPCSTDKVGVCQVEKSGSNSWNTGQFSSRLTYIDGVVNLTYLSGDPYNDKNKTARMTVIIFICDYNAGNGRPQFIEEVNFAYIFYWYTNLLCTTSISNECIVHDTISNSIYDLSSLSVSTKNWMTVINEDGKERQIYINVCRPLVNPKNCTPTAGACLVKQNTDGKEDVIISNLGQATTVPVLETPGHLSLIYKSGDFCVAFGENITYSTVIHFLCAEDKMSQSGSGLRFLSKVGTCEYSFLWTTKAACPIKELKSEDSCQLTDPETGFSFDLNPLRKSKEPFNVPSPSGGNYQFNICGRVEDGCLTSNKTKQSQNVSVCEVNSQDGLILNIAVSDTYSLSYSTGTELTLAYKSVDKSKEAVVIKFPCYNSTADSKPLFLRHENGQYLFELKTNLTCIPNHFDCNVVDQYGNEYDFSPLAKINDGNWEVSDNRPGYSNIKYHVNFCRPLNKVSSYKCPGRASSACQTSLTDSNIGQDLGTQMEEPMVSNKGTVVIRYTDGSLCSNGQFKRSTTINLFCSPEQGELKFMGETPECEYVFSLDTPYACPLESSQGKNCIVKDPLFGYVFDLNPLKSKNNNYNVSVKDFTYFFNVCDKLNNFSDVCANSSACQTKPNDKTFFKSLGLPNDAPVYRKGVITLDYESGTGNCHKQYNRTTRITFTCHHAFEDKDGPIFIAEAEDCTYLFEWPTVHACPPFDVTECSVTDDKGIYYDLSKLSLPNANYYVKNPMSDKNNFVINICRSIVHSPGSLCPYTSAACLIDPSKPEPINLGRVTQAPYFEDGKIKIRYTTGDSCDDGGSSARFMETIIDFSCDPSLIDSEPEFIGVDSCTYFFDWRTAYACPPKDGMSGGNCTVKDPTTGYLFNLSSLKDHGLFKVQNANHQFTLNICGSNASYSCGANSGMCQEELSGEKRHWLGGKLNSNLTFSNGLLYLNYSNGDLCHDGHYQRNTLIEFHCGHGTGEPEFMYESHDCTYFFSLKTQLACQTLMHCAIKNESMYYDLTPLAESYHTAASSVLNDDASYYISVCKSLENISHVSCPPGSAICRISGTTSESLGRVEYPPLIDFMGYATVLYTNGSVCSKNSTLQNRARIIFVCNPDVGEGEPVLMEYNSECLYIFEWQTNVVCSEKPEVPQSFTSCNYTDKNKGINFNLLPLQKSGTEAYYEVVGQSSKFKLNICSNLRGTNTTKCGNAGVCEQSGNVFSKYGVASSQKFSYDGQRLRLSFFDGDGCPSGSKGKRTSEIFFICDPTAGLGKPDLHKKYTCLVVFMWKTSLVCMRSNHQCAFDIDEKHYDFNLLSSLSHNWDTYDDKNNSYLINFCRGVQQTSLPSGCPPGAAVCMVDTKGNGISLGEVQSMEVGSYNKTDLLLKFYHGDRKACMSVHSASVFAVARFSMRCGSSLGHPKWISGPDTECFYDFVWESSLACADKAEEVLIEKDGLIKDSRLDFSFDISEILNRTYTVAGNSTGENYIYKINLSGGVARNTTDPNSTCAKAAVCQTKPISDKYKFFERDIGSLESRTFIVRGTQLHLVFKSLTRACGKNKSKNVTTIINMHCSSSVTDAPTFLYESGNCDYLFEWPTIVVCPSYHRKRHDGEPSTNAYQEIVSHKGQIACGVIFALIATIIILFIVYKPERRAIISSRFRSLFGHVSLPYFRYKRCDGERLVLVEASQTIYDDEELLRC